MAENVEIGLLLRDRLTQGLRKATQSVKKFSSEATGSFKQLGTKLLNVRGLFAGLASAVALRRLAAYTKQIVDLQDNIGKLNRRLGISTEALSELRLAAEQSGVKFTALSVGFQRATRRMEEFRDTGKGVAAVALERLGIANLVREGKTLEELLPRMAEGFRRLGSDAERVRVAFKLFDTEGVALLQLLGLGAKEIERLRQKARDFGLSMDRETTAAAERFNDSLSDLGAVMDGLVNRHIGPLLNALSDLIAIFTTLAVAPGKAAEFFEDLNGVILRVVPGLNTIADDIERIDKGLEKLRKRRESGLSAADRAALDAEREADFQRQLRELREMAASVRRSEDIRRSLEFAGLRRGEANLGPPSVDTPLREEDLKRIREVQAGVNQETEKLNANLAGVVAGLQAVAARGSAFNTMQEGVVSFAASLESNALNAIDDFQTRTKSLGEAWEDAGRQIVRQLNLIIARLIIARALGGIANLTLGSIGSAIGQSVSAQHGGVISGPKSGFNVRMHGIEKAERVRITPLDAASGRGGEQQINVQFLVLAEDAQSFDRKFEQSVFRRREQFAELTLAEMRRRPELAKLIR